MKWTNKWPKKVGWYWIYGEIYKDDEKPELCVLNVWKVSNGLAYVRNGSFYFKSEAGKVYFQKLPEPVTPMLLNQEGICSY